MVKLTLNAHDPDCATTCTAGCGQYIRPDLLVWSDNTGRTPASAFLNSVPGPSGSPWSATVDWVAPATEGSYVVTAAVSDSGGMLCGGRGTTYATLTITVSISTPPVVDSFTVSPRTVPVGGTAQLSATAHDPLGGALTYAFSADAGTIQQASSSSTTAVWTAPLAAGIVNVRCQVSGASGPPVTAQVSAQVVLGNFNGWLPLGGARATRVASLLDGRLVVLDAVAGTAAAVSTAGSVSWTAGSLEQPVATAATASEVFVLERGAKRIAVLSTSGAALRALPAPGQTPAGLAAGPGAGELTVSDTAGAALYVIASSTGQLLRTLGQGTLAFPSGIACNQGKIAVADPGLRRVVLFDGIGNLLATLGDDTLFVRPQGVTWDPVADRLIVSDSFSAELTVMGGDGSVRGQLAGFGTGAGQITAPVDVQLAAGGLLAVPLATTGQVALFQLLYSLPPVAPPTGVVAGDLVGDNGGAIQVRWTKSADDPGRVVSYRIERATSPSNDFTARGWASAGTTSYADSGTIDGQCYLYRVAATDGVTEGVSQPTPCAYSVNDLPPLAPASVSAEAQSPTTAVVTWVPVAAPDLASYAVKVVGTEGTLNLSAPAGGVRLSLTNLLPDHAYQVSVIAIDTAANVSAPALASFSTYPDDAPPTPAGVVVTDTKAGGELSVTWTEAAGRVPVASFHVTLTPATPGWPVVGLDAAQPPVKVGGLINRLAYSVTVTAATPWGRVSAPSDAVQAAPTALPRDLAVVAEVGWPGDKPDADAGGVTVRIPVQSDDRELRFEYRANHSQVMVLLDGVALGNPLADTLGAWAEARLSLLKKVLSGTSVHLLDLRNAGFPDPSALASLRRIDLVPLAVKDLQSAPFNTVVDLTWSWAETRADLTVRASRSVTGPTSVWQDFPCAAPSLARCRDTFRPNDQKAWYRVSTVSPAGWQSESEGTTGQAAYSAGPPPVTDLLVSPADAASGGGWILSWTPLSTALAPDAAPTPVSAYRVYRQEVSGLFLLTEVSAPPVRIPADALDAAGTNAVVRSLDALGRESQ